MYFLWTFRGWHAWIRGFQHHLNTLTTDGMVTECSRPASTATLLAPSQVTTLRSRGLRPTTTVCVEPPQSVFVRRCHFLPLTVPLHATGFL